jgi:ABC-2 type transport system permease protein
MEKVKAIIIFEYLSRVRRLSFLFTTILSPMLALLYLIIPIAFSMAGSGERQVMVLDQSGVPGLFESIKKKVETKRIGTKYAISQIVVDAGQDLDQFRRKFNPEIKKDSAKAYLVLRPGILNGVSPEYYTGGATDFTLASLIADVTSAITEQKLANAGLDAEQYLSPITMKTIKVSDAGEVQGSLANLAVSFIIFMFTFLAIVGHGSQVMSGVIEEKQTRIIEVMVSSAKPIEMMIGKLLGIGLVALTQYLIWVFVAVPILLLNQVVLASQGIILSSIPFKSLVCFIIYFILGYFLFASMYIVGGALLTDSESSNMVTRFMMLLAAMPFMTMTGVLQNPSGMMALTLSFIPFFAAGTMILRLAIVPPPLWQILLSMFLMLVTIAAAIWVAARIYRVGILIYGKKPTIVEIARWVRYT